MSQWQSGRSGHRREGGGEGREAATNPGLAIQASCLGQGGHKVVHIWVGGPGQCDYGVY